MSVFAMNLNLNFDILNDHRLIHQSQICCAISNICKIWFDCFLRWPYACWNCHWIPTAIWTWGTIVAWLPKSEHNFNPLNNKNVQMKDEHAVSISNFIYHAFILTNGHVCQTYSFSLQFFWQNKTANQQWNFLLNLIKYLILK